MSSYYKGLFNFFAALLLFHDMPPDAPTGQPQLPPRLAQSGRLPGLVGLPDGIE
ncbi:MAG: hypothetical protein L6Q97_10035 [Thermoanaerobaculia bacterium]|nr:hypothetical protein [Thermoanaerobaculia bacterium]